MIPESELNPEFHAKRLVSHHRWKWRCGMVLMWPDMPARYPIITQVASSEWGTLVVNFLHSGVGIEIDPLELNLYPDLSHPATAGILMSMWLESSPQAFMSISRWGKGEPSVQRTHPKKWAVTMGMTQDSEGSFLGLALAKMLYMTWRRQERMTPKRITGPLSLAKLASLAKSAKVSGSP